MSNKPPKKDALYANPLGAQTPFTFDKTVVDVFPDMISRSVPGYASIISITGVLAGQYAQAGTKIYDLGCSLGASSLAMAAKVAIDDCEIHAVDNSEAMVAKFRQVLAARPPQVPVKLTCDDICALTFEPLSVAVLNFTLQFVPAQSRGVLLENIYAAMVPGAVLLLSEKIRFDDANVDKMMIDLHHEFKRANDYSELEISQKRSALEDVLVPETLAEHRARLEAAGFTRVEVWFQCFNFISLVAFK